MMKATGLFLLLLFSMTAVAYVPKEGNVSAILGALSSQTLYPNPPKGVKNPRLGGVGLIVQGDISDKGNLEISMLHTNKVFFREQGSGLLAERSQFMHISMGYRYWMTHYFSVGLAFYSAYSMGEPEITTNTLQSDGITTSARDKTEYGFDFSLMGEVWSHDRIALMLDGKYSYSVTPKENEYADNYLFLIGIRYFIQEKQVIERPKP